MPRPSPRGEARHGRCAGGRCHGGDVDSGTNEDIPLWAKKVGHQYLGNVEEAGFWRLFVKRGK